MLSDNDVINAIHAEGTTPADFCLVVSKRFVLG